MQRTGPGRVFNSIVLIALAVFLAAGLTIALPDSTDGRILPRHEQGDIYPALQASGILPAR